MAAPLYAGTPPLTCWYFSYWSDAPERGLELYLRERRLVLAFPADEGLLAVFVAWPAAALPRVRTDVHRHFMDAVDRIPNLAERVRGGRQEERFFGASDLPNFLRRPHGPGWALVGDAGCHKDPFLALGMSDALRDAELLATALADALTGSSTLAEGLAEYHRQRDAATLASYRLDVSLARTMAPPAALLRLRAAARGDPEATRRHFLLGQGVEEENASYLGAAP